MTWFEQLTGFREGTLEDVQSMIEIDGDSMVFPNGSQVRFGQLETPSLGELRSRVLDARGVEGPLRLKEVVGDVRDLHSDPQNADSLFQVASQFNLLEMANPTATPECGVGIYEGDPTQGPACAICCGAGTIYRNYFARVGDQIGQTSEQQIDCAADLGRRFDNRGDRLWKMQNGYLFPSDYGLDQITTKLQMADTDELNDFRSSLRIGLQWNTAVTIASPQHTVSQAYCSALPVAYGRQPSAQWQDFAKLVLEAAYESTFCAAILNFAATGSNRLMLTLLGGGVFGNRESWICNAIERSVERYKHFGLDVAIVSYSSSKPSVADMVGRFKQSGNDACAH